jgi:hypothetical protein
MDSTEGLKRRAEFLFLVCRDFWDVAMCVDHLLDPSGPAAHLDPRVRQVLEAGTLVTYCRPFSGGSGRTISPAPDLSAELRSFHDDIVQRRNTVYAHSDHTDHRTIQTLRARGLDLLADPNINIGDLVVREGWDSLTEKGLACLRELSRIHYARTGAELDRLRSRIG